MAKILADREIKKLLGSVFIDADEEFINPNGIELRLGVKVRFHSTGETKELHPDSFLKVNPGESVLISSMEKIDFTAKTVQHLYPNKMLMGLITPTTTMMREGIAQVATKIDAGFRGNLNWGLRNGSAKELILQYGEPIFKLTIFLLEKDELPDIPYGEGKTDFYQDTDGIKGSARHLPADIPKDKIVSSSFDKLDPKKQLREAGYPFNHIGTELVDLHGKFEVVSKDVTLLKGEFEKRTSELSSKIEKETGDLSKKIEEQGKTLGEKIDTVFQNKFLRLGSFIVGSIPIISGGILFLQNQKLSIGVILLIVLGTGALIIFTGYLLTRKTK
ncbi:MAG: hypothetical protein E3J71_07530 [Candidatus Stahlbacteria bacterium]|nr:MAG: hypothetical protein E3J71_07530 [Candidatus Stahlbacteria bacterium]